MLLRFLAGLILFCAGSLPFGAEAAPNHIHAELVAETSRPAAGKSVSLAFVMKPDAGWHGYWKNPGDAGMETRVAWTLPQGVRAGELLYPVPDRLLIAGLMNYVYEHEYAHPLRFDIPAGLTPGTLLPIRARLDWLACTNEICVPEKAELAIDLVVGDGAIASADRVRFDGFRAALPRPLDRAAMFSIESGQFRLAVPIPSGLDVGEPYFYPLADGVLQYAPPQTVRRNGDRLVIEAAVKAGAGPRFVEGVLELGQGLGVSLRAEPGPVPKGGTVIATAANGSKAGFIATILLSFGAAVLGGIILNIMPCVFPIISLKALSLARAGETAQHARREALAYAAGVIVVCAALGAILLLLRSGGEAVGWAFQLQDPRVSLLLLLLVSTIGFNLAGLFELPNLSFGGRLADSGGIGGAFWTGMLAAFVATPCTGPFMAGALGAALLLPGAAALAIFGGLGLGIALPFVLLGFVPALRSRLPRPGAWMETARKILSVPMFATAVGLAWIVGRQAGVNAMALSLVAVAMAALGLWWGGERQRRGLGGAWLPALPLLVAALTLVAILPQERTMATTPSSGEAFSEGRLAALRAERRPVFLYFTADWCLTCKVNEKAAIERTEVSEAFARKGIVTMVGDWTRGEPAISRFLAERGRAGVPLYLFYPAGGGEPVELPQVLTPSMLVELQ